MNPKNKLLIILRKINTLLAVKGIFNFLPDELFLKMRYRLCTGKKLNLTNPKSFNEKIQWLKINNRKLFYSTMVDKILVKQYVAKKIGEEYIIPTIATWENARDIDFDILPNQFVLKCNHDSGGIVICKDKKTLNEKSTIKKLNKALKRNSYYPAREWPYKNVQRKILAEHYLEDTRTEELRDYKFFTFNGKVRLLFVASDRQDPNKKTKFDFFDENFERLSIINGHPNSEIIPQKPINFELMKELAEKLGEGIPHVRVDFYEVDGKVYFGELTFSHYGGFVPFEPEEWDYKIGKWLELPGLELK